MLKRLHPEMSVETEAKVRTIDDPERLYDLLERAVEIRSPEELDLLD